MYEHILDALRRGADAEALAAARAAVEANPTDPRAHHMLALAQRATGEEDASMESIDRAIALAPDDAGLHFQRAGFLVGGRDIDEAQKALARTLELDPNSFNAYVVQAELAVGRGDLDESERLVRVASRIAPDHPSLASVQGMVALRRGQPERALSILTAAQARTPDDPQLLYALGFAYLENNHLAFAEQTFRRVAERGLGGASLPQLLAEVMYRQGRPKEALAELEPLLADGASAPGSVLRSAGEMELVMQRPEQALERLRPVLASMPADAKTLDMMMEAWRRLGAAEDAINTLEAALATSPQVEQLWLARLSLEQDHVTRRALVDRWLEAAPTSIAAHEALLSLHGAAGEAEAFEATLRRILELEPGNVGAEGRLLDILMQRDPQEGLQRAQSLQQIPRSEQMKRVVRGWLALASDKAGEHEAAAKIWAELHASVADGLVPLLPHGPADAPRRPAGEAAADAPAAIFLSGLPGTAIEYVARLLDGVVPLFRADRISGRPPQDLLQNINTIPDLAAGKLDPSEVATSWRSALPARGLSVDGALIDWLLWWDNALLDMIRPEVPHARVLLTLRDPRDMLLNWMAFGAPVPMRLGTPMAAARWLAGALEHVAVLQEQNLQQHAILRVDDIANEPAALGAELSRTLGLQLPEPPRNLFQGRRFDAGHWRKYAKVLEEPFAVLTPVAIRLGYPAS
ncbi:tetratricopeptide repeat protein [Luteimonas sp. A277]